MTLKAIKTIFSSLILTIFLFISLVATQSKLYKPLIKWILEKKGLQNLEGEEKGIETFNASFGLILPILFCISLVIVLSIMKIKRSKF